MGFLRDCGTKEEDGKEILNSHFSHLFLLFIIPHAIFDIGDMEKKYKLLNQTSDMQFLEKMTKNMSEIFSYATMYLFGKDGGGLDVG